MKPITPTTQVSTAVPPIEVTINEGMVVDPRTNTDKFYRTYAFADRWTTHYGRNGEVGTLGKVVTAASPEAAIAAADKKYASKARGSGYRATYSGVISAPIDDLDNALEVSCAIEPVLEQLRDADLDWSTRTGVIEQVPAAPVALRLPDRTNEVTTVLDMTVNSRLAVSADLDPTDLLLPMLASVPATPEELDALMGDPNVVAQRKYDGDRVLVRIRDGEITVLNRQGLAKVRNVRLDHTTCFTALDRGHWVFDGEVVGHTLVLFDLLYASDGLTCWTTPEDTFEHRYVVLEAILGVLDPNPETIALAPVSHGTDGKSRLLAEAIARSHEGIILRRIDGTYQQGLRSSFLVKHKLLNQADVVISSLHPDKQSATLAVTTPEGLQEVGAASTIGKGPVNLGEVWLVTYLYVTDPDHPRLYQPRLEHSRTDKSADECLLDQFVGAVTDKTL